MLAIGLFKAAGKLLRIGVLQSPLQIVLNRCVNAGALPGLIGDFGVNTRNPKQMLDFVGRKSSLRQLADQVDRQLALPVSPNTPREDCGHYAYQYRAKGKYDSDQREMSPGLALERNSLIPHAFLERTCGPTAFSIVFVRQHDKLDYQCFG